MTDIRRESPALRAGRRWIYWTLFIALTLLLWLATVRLPRCIHFSDDNELSWQMLLHYAFANRWQWGSDFIFTFGPLGFVLNDVYFPETVRYSLTFCLLFHALCIGLAVQVILEARSWLAKISLVVLLLGVGFLTPAFSRDALYTALIWLIAAGYVASGSRSLVRGLLIAGVMVTLSLTKFTLLAWNVVILGVFVLNLWRTRGWLAASALLGGSAILAVAGWMAAGQSLAGFPVYLISCREISQGYVIGMSLPGPDLQVKQALLIGIGILLLILLSVISRQFRRRAILIAGLTSLTLFLIWKHGFVRQDLHTTIFFAVVPCLAMSGYLGSDHVSRSTIARVLQSILCVAVVGMAWKFGFDVLNHIDSPYKGRINARSIRNRISENFWRITHIRDYLAEQDAEWQLLKKRERRQDLAARVGDEPVAWYMNSQSVPIVSGITLSPRGVIQSYSAYTRWLAQEDEQPFLGSAPPRFVVVNIDPIDNRWPLGDDGLALLQIISQYRPVASLSGNLLFERQSGAKPVEPLGPDLVDQTCGFDESIEIPPRRDRWKVFSVEIRPSNKGRLLNTLFRTPPVRIQLDCADGVTHDYRIIPGQSETWSLLDPLVIDNQSLATLFSTTNHREVRRIRITVDDKDRDQFASSIRIRVREYPVPPK